MLLETLAGGCGARSFKDGKDGLQLYAANSANMPIEVFETAFPILIERYEFAQDTGGAGKFRGGLGLRRIYRPQGDCLFVGSGDRFTHEPWGLFGARPGGSGRYAILEPSGQEHVLSSKPAPFAVTAGSSVVVQSPGAGGYGDPGERSEESLARDLFSGKYSEAFITREYGANIGRLRSCRIDHLLDYDEAELDPGD